MAFGDAIEPMVDWILVFIAAHWGSNIGVFFSFSPTLAIMSSTPSVLCWNCCGERNAQFLLSLNEIKKVHKPMVVFSLAPWIYGPTADSICKQLGKHCWFKVEASGLSSGIWLHWNKEVVRLRVIHAHKQFVHLSIWTTNAEAWELTVVYANPNPTIRTTLWGDLKLLQTNALWLLRGILILFFWAWKLIKWRWFAWFHGGHAAKWINCYGFHWSAHHMKPWELYHEKLVSSFGQRPLRWCVRALFP